MAIRTKTFVSHWPRLPGDLYNSCFCFLCVCSFFIPYFMSTCRPMRLTVLDPPPPVRATSARRGSWRLPWQQGHRCVVLCLYGNMGRVRKDKTLVNVEPSYCPTFPFFLSSILPSFSPFHPLLFPHRPFTLGMAFSLRTSTLLSCVSPMESSLLVLLPPP